MLTVNFHGEPAARAGNRGFARGSNPVAEVYSAARAVEWLIRSYASGTSGNTTVGLKIGADVGNNTSRTLYTRKFASIGGAKYSNSLVLAIIAPWCHHVPFGGRVVEVIGKAPFAFS